MAWFKRKATPFDHHFDISPVSVSVPFLSQRTMYTLPYYWNAELIAITMTLSIGLRQRPGGAQLVVSAFRAQSLTSFYRHIFQLNANLTSKRGWFHGCDPTAALSYVPYGTDRLPSPLPFYPHDRIVIDLTRGSLLNRFRDVVLTFKTWRIS